jgi:hypothetical protein
LLFFFASDLELRVTGVEERVNAAKERLDDEPQRCVAGLQEVREGMHAHGDGLELSAISGARHVPREVLADARHLLRAAQR